MMQTLKTDKQAALHNCVPGPRPAPNSRLHTSLIFQVDTQTHFSMSYISQKAWERPDRLLAESVAAVIAAIVMLARDTIFAEFHQVVVV